MLFQLANLPRSQKKILLILFDLFILNGILLACFFIRLGEPFSSNLLDNLHVLVLVPPLNLMLFYYFGLYNKVIRFLTPKFFLASAKALSAGTAVFLGLVVLMQAEGVPRSVYFMYWALGLSAIGGIRLLARELLPVPNQLVDDKKIRVGIYGAGAAGTQLAQALRSSREYAPIFFVDDNHELWNWEISGIKIFDPSKLHHLVKAFEVQEMIFSIPSLARSDQQKLLSKLANLPVKIRTLPSIVNLVDGRIRVEDIKRVQIEDLLGRKPVDPIPELIQANINGKHVLVTGAGGSIGSELCRQIVKQIPAKLILLEVSEYALFRIHSELKRTNPKIHYATILGSVVDEELMIDVLKTHSVQTIYHTAAYKHVPIVEKNILAGYRNNVLGTKAVAEAAERAGVERMILISTDKAVRPSSVMGATKRLAELVLQAKAKKGRQQTVFTIVRFGNVLGSSGSVVPIFRGQIKKGGPVTITDDRMTRYFMTIPEAAQLVIQAGAMASGGEVFLLDMGEPVKILDLARKMIHLSGFSLKTKENPNGDIEIQMIGIRPGEKLTEELLIENATSDSIHPRIKHASEQHLEEKSLYQKLQKMEKLIQLNTKEPSLIIFELFKLAKLESETTSRGEL